MKRGRPLQRKTPLTARTPLKRSGGPSPSQMPKRRTPVKQRREEPRRRDIDVTHGTVMWQDVRRAVLKRSGGACEICGTGLTMETLEGHHRRTRRLGPDCPGNVLALCSTCHHDIAHGMPAEAKAAGWVVSRHEPNPCVQPVRVRGRLVVLTCDGEYAPAA